MKKQGISVRSWRKKCKKQNEEFHDTMEPEQLCSIRIGYLKNIRPVPALLYTIVTLIIIDSILFVMGYFLPWGTLIKGFPVCIFGLAIFPFFFLAVHLETFWGGFLLGYWMIFEGIFININSTANLEAWNKIPSWPAYSGYYVWIAAEILLIVIGVLVMAERFICMMKVRGWGRYQKTESAHEQLTQCPICPNCGLFGEAGAETCEKCGFSLTGLQVEVDERGRQIIDKCPQCGNPVPDRAMECPCCHLQVFRGTSRRSEKRSAYPAPSKEYGEYEQADRVPC